MSKRTQPEIDAEIAALKSLIPIGQFTRRTQMKIDLAIEELKDGIDTTAPEWDELGESLQDVVMQTTMWKEGDTDSRPSEGWGDLVSKTKKPTTP